MLRRQGFRVEAQAAQDRFSYRLMSVLLGRDQDTIHEYRIPITQLSGAPRRFAFLRVLLEAMRIRSLSLWVLMLARRI